MPSLAGARVDIRAVSTLFCIFHLIYVTDSPVKWV
jgi:hypothetical protein